MKKYYNKTLKTYYTEGLPLTYQPSAYSIWTGVPSAEKLAEFGFEEIIEPTYEYVPYTPSYPELVAQKIRERYTIDDEFAIQRQKETKPQEWQEYYDYCEACKVAAKNELGIVDDHEL